MNYDDDEIPLVRSRDMKPQHDFQLNRDTRRFVCAKCGGLMNECEAYCAPKTLG